MSNKNAQYESKQIVFFFVAKLLKYITCIPTFLGLDYTDFSLITLYLDVIKIIISKIR